MVHYFRVITPSFSKPNIKVTKSYISLTIIIVTKGYIKVSIYCIIMTKQNDINKNAINVNSSNDGIEIRGDYSNCVWHLDVGSSHPGAVAGPKGMAINSAFLWAKVLNFFFLSVSASQSVFNSFSS